MQRNRNSGKRSRRRSAPAPEAATAPPLVEEIPAATRRGGLTVSDAFADLRPVEEPPAAATAAPTRRRRVAKPAAEVPEVVAPPAEKVTTPQPVEVVEVAAPQSAEAAAPETAAT